MTFPIEKIREDFPILHQKIKGMPLVYLDNAATSQKPQVVINAVCHYYEKYNANIHRAVHTLSERATLAYEEARTACQHFIHAKEAREIIFCSGTTVAINLVAQTYVRSNVKLGDEILITALEHHSNIVPWQMVCEQTGAVLKVAPINELGEVIQSDFDALLSSKTKFISIVHISNALGTVNPIKEMIEKAHAVGAKVLIDGAQALPHMPVDVQALGCDFYAASGHKVFAPTGIGFLYGKAELLISMPPYQGGGDMIRTVSFEKTTYADIPYKFEAGTPNIEGAIGLKAALDYINTIGLEKIYLYEQELLAYATQQALLFPDIRIIGTAQEKASILSFVLEGIHPHDIGTLLDEQGIAVRTGHHCAMPIMKFFKVPATVRASFAFYNTMEEIDKLFEGLNKVRKIFKK